jgi:5-methylcytosine-specific restriction protein A
MPWAPKRHIPPGRDTAAIAQHHGDTHEAHEFYSSSKWRKFREGYLQRHPLCVTCKAKGFIVAATEVHHIKSRLQHPELTFEESNLEGDCKPCHSRHTMKERHARSS